VPDVAPSDAARRPLFDVTDRVVIVTGASSGIGRMLTVGLTDAGAIVVAFARRKELLDEVVVGRRALAVAGDVADDADRERLIAETLAAYGRIDGLVNNAGISGSGFPASRQTTEEFRQVLEVDLVAPFDLSKRCLPAFREQGGGSIVNVTSTAAIVSCANQIPQAAYCAAKGGLAHLTKELAVQWGRYKVRVNAFAPGSFQTEMTELMFTEGTPAYAAQLRSRERTAIKRTAGQDDAVGVVQYLLSDASTFVTGQHIAVDGGYTVG
jgi:NAD(P)-dependent dehydrogenase (short-subunit alcohol dehydrogenase family)